MPTIPPRIREVYDKATCIFTKEQVDSALDRMANAINVNLCDANPVLICVVIGGIVPTGNLMPRLNIHFETDYIHITRYHGNTSGGRIKWLAEPVTDLKDRNILIVDDILDAGETLTTIMDYCKKKGANDIYTAVLVEKNRKRKDPRVETANFRGLLMDERFVFGYGLDYDNYLRNAPGIYAVAPEHM